MTSGLASRLSVGMGLAKDNHVVEYGLRAVRYLIVLISLNGLMEAIILRGSSVKKMLLMISG